MRIWNLIGGITARQVLSVSLTLLVNACGGGGGGASGAPSANARTPLAELTQDMVPAGTRIDVSADEFFVFASGDRAIYDGTSSFGTSIQVVREVTDGPDAQGRVIVRESVLTNPNIEPAIERWQPRPEGMVAIDYLGDGAPQAFKSRVGDTLIYPTPFYPAGSVRSLIRQGTLGADLDGDGSSESFRLEFKQEFIGFETGKRGGRQERRARFKNTVVLLVQPSRRDLLDVTLESVEEIVFAAHTGVISAYRTERTNGDASGEYSGPSGLSSGILAGRDINSAWNAGTTRYVPLYLFDLVYEPVNGYYYAGVGMRDTRAPGTIARINPATGEVAFSVSLGADVRSIAVSADGATLYAGVQGVAEIVKVSLPDMQIQQRIPLDQGTWAYGLTVSPVDPSIVALYLDNSSRGPLLVRNGVVQASSPGFSGARSFATDSPMLFSADGAHVFMFGSAGTASGLLRLDVVADGLDSQVHVASVLPGGVSLSRDGGNIVAGKGLYRGSDMALLGSVSNIDFSSCRAMTGTRKWVCDPGPLAGLSVGVVDSSSFATLVDGVIPFDQPPYQFVAGNFGRAIPGPRGQVAITVGAGLEGWLALFDNPDFQ